MAESAISGDALSWTASCGAVYRTNLSPELLKKAETELNEKDKWRDRDIQALRDMVLAHRGKRERERE